MEFISILIIITRFFVCTRMRSLNIFEVNSKTINRIGRGKREGKITLSFAQNRDLRETLNPLFLSIVIHKVIKIATRQKYYNSDLREKHTESRKKSNGQRYFN